MKRGGCIVEGLGGAINLGNLRNGVLVRPLGRWMAYNNSGCAFLTRTTIDRIGAKPDDAAVRAGITYDAMVQRDTVRWARASGFCGASSYRGLW